MDDKLKYQIANNLIKEISNYSQNKIEDNTKVEFIVKELLDESKKKILDLDNQETSILRDKLGINNDGNMNTMTVLSKKYNINNGIINTKLNNIYRKVNLSIIIHDASYKKTKNRISSSYLYSNFKNNKLEQLELDDEIKTIISNLNRNKNYPKISTLNDIMSYCAIDYRHMRLSKTIISKIYALVHKLGYKMLDELNNEEKYELIKKSDIEIINNSVLSIIDNSYYTSNSNYNVCYIKDLINDKIDFQNKESIIKKANKLGLDIENNSINKITNRKELLKQDLNYSGINKNLCRVLILNEINTIEDLIKINRTDLTKFKGIGQKKADEIIDFIHSKDLLFKDEINKEETSSINIIINNRNDLVERINKLREEKELLKEESIALDKKITELLIKIKSIDDGAKSNGR